MKETTLIPNTIVERMFLRIGNDQEVKQFVQLAEDSTARATAYASRKVFPVFEALVSQHERMTGGEGVEPLKKIVYRADRKVA
jgi:hypothetical protein